MLHTFEKLHSIVHPLVASMHLKKDMGKQTNPEDVLVINARLPDPDDDYETFDAYLMDLLFDLENLKKQAETCVGKFDRIDIRTS